MPPPSFSADDITKSLFKGALAKYPLILQAVSDKKGAKGGQETLAELDTLRYEAIVDRLSETGQKDPMSLDDIKKLVQWKLRHGKFRPTLMKLVSSNDPDTARNTVERAVGLYRDEEDAAKALSILCELRGIGPATASLLLAVHEPSRVIFFGDEMFYWLCCGGKVQSAKYNMKEYVSLHEKATALAKRLDASMLDIEKVAFVVLKQDEYPEAMDSDTTSTTSAPTAAEPESEHADSKEVLSSRAKSEKTRSTAKRKMPSDTTTGDATLGRSNKRGSRGKRRA